MKRARLIYNPTSGKEGIQKKLPYILDRFEGMGYETSTHATKGKNDAKEAALDAVKRKFDLIVAAGGDGTINEVVSGMAEKEYRPKLAVLPMGTSNDFARVIGIPKEIKSMMDTIENGKVKKIDIGKINHQHFINVSGGGALTELSYEVPSRLKTAIGQFAYYLKGIEKLPKFKPYHAEIKTDTMHINEEIMLFLVSNGSVIGGFDQLIPDAKIDDGLFDVIVLKKTNITDMVRILTSLHKGEHLKDEKICYLQTKKMSVKTDDQIQLNLDGEFGGMLPVDIQILERHIEMIVNEKK